jgi:hypothetical protein
MYIVLFQYILLGPLVSNIGTIIAGHIAVIFGLFFFMEGLKTGIMPLGDTLGYHLPERVNFGWVLFVSFWTGTLGTFNI